MLGQQQRSQWQPQLFPRAARLAAGPARLSAGAPRLSVGAVSKGSPLGSGSAAKSSGWKRSSIWQIRCRDRPGTTSDRMARSVSTSFGIISRSAVARSLGKYVYLQAQQPGPWSTDASRRGATTVQVCSPAGQHDCDRGRARQPQGAQQGIPVKLRTGCTASSIKGPSVSTILGVALGH